MTTRKLIISETDLALIEARARIKRLKKRIKELEEWQALGLRGAEADAEIIATQNRELTEAAERIVQLETELTWLQRERSAASPLQMAATMTQVRREILDGFADSWPMDDDLGLDEVLDAICAAIEPLVASIATRFVCPDGLDAHSYDGDGLEYQCVRCEVKEKCPRYHAYVYADCAVEGNLT